MLCVTVPARLSPIPGKAADIHQREVACSIENGHGRGGKSQRRRIDRPFVLAHIRFLEALPAGADVQNGRRDHRVDMVGGDAVVDAIEEIADGPDAVDPRRVGFRDSRLSFRV